jgi:hypothetical protein
MESRVLSAVPGPAMSAAMARTGIPGAEAGCLRRDSHSIETAITTSNGMPYRHGRPKQFQGIRKSFDPGPTVAVVAMLQLS